MKTYMKNAAINKSINRSQGFSLLEVLISMAIGLFLLVGITTSYVSSKKSSLIRSEVSILEDSGRAALELLSESLQHTGYLSTELITLENPFILAQPVTTSCGADSNINGTYRSLTGGDYITNDTADDGDSIGSVYMGDEFLDIDCAGEQLPVACQAGESVSDVNAHKIYNTFYVEGDELKCHGSVLNQGIVIAEGIENMQILYGVDIDDDSSVERYVNSDDVGRNWSKVISLQIAILVRASSETKSESESISYSLLDTQVNSPDDRYERAVFSTSINLRNL